MPLCTLKQALEEARKGHYALGAFNVNNMEQIQGIIAAAAETKSPVIIQASRGALKYTELNYLKHMILAAVELHPEIPVVLHLDHGDSLETAKTAILLGFTSVMIDASSKPYEENVRITKEVVEYAHAFGVSVEAELGTLGGIEEDVSGVVKLTDPKQATEFVAATGVDALAVAIGTSHGAYKFKSTPVLAIDLVETISKATEKPLVMHGSSSVPQEILADINKYGGKMPDAQGVPIPAIQNAIERGVCKVNVDTDSRMAMTATIRKIFTEQPGVFDPREYLGPAREATKQLVMSKMRDFGTAGHAGDYVPISLEEAKKTYYGL
ncbi:fructose bisphosphate aldolase (FBA) [Monocercomonoides exilis]|uniref:fructose bisphosphate aldolase (FBA) n=1 Tax=Monocercomonoides exilis TaxID=2049356 RepID=UPI00355A4996|nr:fructose bisphosphate aldolase (FBA) [Monocercomonoides exilis]|eukprot:MONOS_10869.1-p1 / transcript=MONOS_10869.1 / gene=MONOS_10869 / organism=Monocercomonoides_exilis_PA203 / gene_product=fructose bisphosphate aldolase (FBA) / transcript_product=fructose bisphosphate aldolase (FBA) / location=Mono_scaffold00513:21212-22263(-) / protein_length=324 / sequence_SO=supercontig / SO=protein_coding / is_pseudo=false